jgi:uncharacterized protein YaaR (DUF327 family)
MERIDFHGGLFSIPPKSFRNKKSSVQTSKTAKNFSALLRTDAEEELNARSVSAVDREDVTELSEALDRVHTVGEKLKKNPSPDTMDEYRSAVRSFLRIVTEACYQVEEQIRTLPKRGIETKTALVRIVDEKLEKFAAKIMRGQKDQFEILRRVDEIYGILVDLLL